MLGRGRIQSLEFTVVAQKILRDRLLPPEDLYEIRLRHQAQDGCKLIAHSADQFLIIQHGQAFGPRTAHHAPEKYIAFRRSVLKYARIE